MYQLFTGEIKLEDQITIKKLKGIYISETWNGKGSSITLNDDLTCIISLSDAKCKWKIKENEIIIHKSVANHETEYKAILKDNGFTIEEYFFEKMK